MLVAITVSKTVSYAVDVKMLDEVSLLTNVLITPRPLIPNLSSLV